MTAAAADQAGGFPLGIRQEHLQMRHEWVWPRRVMIVLLTALCAFALANVFGQRQTVTSADSPAAALTVDSPERLRSGLIFTTNFTVVAHQPLKDARLVLAHGWWKDMTLNAEGPQPSSEGSNAQGVILDYGPVTAGQDLTIWISWQTNPTMYGSRDETVWLYDGDQLLLSIPRSLVVFP